MKFVLALTVVALISLPVQAQWGRRRNTPPAPPPNKTVTVYHLFEPKFTGLANKDGGDFLGDASFIFLTFSQFEVENPEADIQDNIIEMSTVTVDDWSKEYLKCNAPGATYNGSHGQQLDCPKTNTDYCCEGNSSQVTADTLPGYENSRMTGGGYWMSFPKESEGAKWTEKKERRIKGSCVGNLWRKQAGGCPACGANLDQCVAQCIETALCPSSGWGKRDYTKLRPTWEMAFSNKTLCPDQPFPGVAGQIVV